MPLVIILYCHKEKEISVVTAANWTYIKLTYSILFSWYWFHQSHFIYEWGNYRFWGSAGMHAGSHRGQGSTLGWTDFQGHMHSHHTHGSPVWIIIKNDLGEG